MSSQTRDVRKVASRTEKKELLDKFSNTLQNKVLYVKDEKGDFVKALPDSSIANDGYFIKKATLKKLLTIADQKRQKYVLVNFAIGRSASQGEQLQLMFTVVDSLRMVAPDDLGALCLTTAKRKNSSSEPPIDGIPHPHPPRTEED